MAITLWAFGATDAIIVSFFAVDTGIIFPQFPQVKLISYRILQNRKIMSKHQADSNSRARFVCLY